MEVMAILSVKSGTNKIKDDPAPISQIIYR